MDVKKKHIDAVRLSSRIGVVTCDTFKVPLAELLPPVVEVAGVATITVPRTQALRISSTSTSEVSIFARGGNPRAYLPAVQLNGRLALCVRDCVITGYPSLLIVGNCSLTIERVDADVTLTRSLTRKTSSGPFSVTEWAPWFAQEGESIRDYMYSLERTRTSVAQIDTMYDQFSGMMVSDGNKSMYLNTFPSNHRESKVNSQTYRDLNITSGSYIVVVSFAVTVEAPGKPVEATFSVLQDGEVVVENSPSQCEFPDHSGAGEIMCRVSFTAEEKISFILSFKTSRDVRRISLAEYSLRIVTAT